MNLHDDFDARDLLGVKITVALNADEYQTTCPLCGEIVDTREAHCKFVSQKPDFIRWVGIPCHGCGNSFTMERVLNNESSKRGSAPRADGSGHRPDNAEAPQGAVDSFVYDMPALQPPRESGQE